MNHFDQASRFAAKLDASAFLRWLLNDADGRYRFHRWLDARRLPFPGDPERFCDTVAELDDRDEPSPPWAVPVEFQTEPDAAMFGRFLIYLGQLWLELRPDEERGSRYQVGGIVVNLTGQGNSSRDMALGATGLRTTLGIIDVNLAGKDAQTVLDGIAAGTIGRALLPWIPLMRGGGEAGIIERWKELALQEPSERRRGEYGGWHGICRGGWPQPAWKDALKEWNVKVSQQVLEWQAEAREGRPRGRQKPSSNFWQPGFPMEFPLTSSRPSERTRDLTKLREWTTSAANSCILG